ncbi:MAG: flavodoxin family protein [Candidatus Thorarchaeota archaeon]|nr:MAG: flavodoxin family protein [Candidatus Thorarchaeota archaeon]
MPLSTIVLHGSPRRGGNSDTLAEHFVKGLRDSGDVDVKDFYLNEMEIRPCRGCESCQTSEGNKCVIDDDDMQQIYSVFGDADIVVWANPSYWGYLTGQLKTALDRMEALAMNPEKYFVDKEFVAILTYRYHYESIVSFFERVQDHFRFKFNVITFCSLNEGSHEDLHVSSSQAKLDEAYQLGKKLGSR